MIAVIRITGDINLKAEIRQTLERFNLKRKYSCTVLNETAVNKGMIQKLRDFVAYGKIKDETFVKLIEKRAKLIDKTKKLDPKKIVEQLGAGKKYKELNIKPCFRLHPPRKGIEAKKHFGVGKGVLGDNEEKINELIERML